MNTSHGHNYSHATSASSSDLVTTKTSDVASIKPFQNPKVTALFPDGVYNKEGTSINPSELDGKHIGVYFSANWCAPCHQFTPKLVNFRNRNQREFEVVLVSLCNSEAEKWAYIYDLKMDWLATPGARSEKSERLASQFNVKGIPHLVVLGRRRRDS